MNAPEFLLTGSSARKIRNLLPGRVRKLHMDPLVLEEVEKTDIHQLILNGSLPGIWGNRDREDVSNQLMSYVQIYLEEEIRKEAMVRNLSNFAQCLRLACIDSGNIMSFRGISKEIGISHSTISDYFQILEECMVIERFEPISKSQTRKKLNKSPKYLLFDLGVRRLGANEGLLLSEERLSHLFEQWVGLELRRLCRLKAPRTQVKFWRDHSGPEVDWVLEKDQEYLPIEVKWTERPVPKDARHLEMFLDEYPTVGSGVVICRIDQAQQLTQRVKAIPWEMVPSLIQNFSPI